MAAMAAMVHVMPSPAVYEIGYTDVHSSQEMG